MVPSVGRIVRFHQPLGEAPRNGASEHAAIITRVWSEDCVNLLVFFDCAAPEPRTSIRRDPGPGGGPRWDWPARD